MSEVTHTFKPGSAVSFTAGGTITAGQVVVLSADRKVVASSAASVAVVGVAARDAVNLGEVLVLSGGYHKLTVSADITYGVRVKAAAAGKVAAWVSGTDDASLAIGTVIVGALANAKALVKLDK